MCCSARSVACSLHIRSPSNLTVGVWSITSHLPTLHTRWSGWAASARSAWILLLEAGVEGEPLLLQAKQAEASALAPYAGESEYANHAERVVAGQHLMQASSDIFLGWLRAQPTGGRDEDYYIRQLRDWKMSAVIEEMGPRSMDLYAGLCGWTLARAHARAGDRIAISAYLGKSTKFDNAIADFAETYADQNERDHAALAAAVAAGRLEAQSGM
jgi:hypothetical protein